MPRAIFPNHIEEPTRPIATSDQRIRRPAAYNVSATSAPSLLSTGRRRDVKSARQSAPKKLKLKDQLTHCSRAQNHANSAPRLPFYPRRREFRHHEDYRFHRLRARRARRARRHLCGNQIYNAFVLNRRVDLQAIDATLLDGVAMSVPHRSTEPARPRHRREMTW